MGWLDIFDPKKRKPRIVSVGYKDKTFGLILQNFNIIERMEFCLYVLKGGATEISCDEVDTSSVKS
jgi:hypothetical protein